MEDVKVVLLAGGFGTRLAEETEIRPKPMVEIGGRPILWHIMNIYAAHGFKHFVVALGYKGEYIKRYFHDYYSLHGDMTFDFKNGSMTARGERNLDWTVELVDTGLHTMTGGRIKRLRDLGVIGDKTFMLTYGDGVSDVHIRNLYEYHKGHGKLATMTAVRPPARFGVLEFEGNNVRRFAEKSQFDVGWINGGFFCLEPGAIDYVDDYDTYWERIPLEKMADDGELMAYKHDSFWQCMDTLRDKTLLQGLWESGNAPWVIDPASVAPVPANGVANNA
ncbi:MAG: glucose-1-phosphate cytidylyltransferase [Anaerolineae bacterium]|nr:glucose-1-phosphate cytidylyltransferase [Anaerolineae bacterium]